MPTTDGCVFDAVIAGTGMGGATLGYELARRGRTVLFLESGRDAAAPDAIRGRPPETEADFGARSAELLERSGRWPAPVQDALRGDAFIPHVGFGTGGSSALYGGALERFFPRDFERWPCSATELAPWYDAAERLYGVCGTADPLRGEPCAIQPPATPLSPANQVVFSYLEGRGLHPYRLHLALARGPECRMCQGHLCHSSCKRDARTACLEPALATGNAALRVRAPAERVEMEGRRAVAVRVNGSAYPARVVVLSAGALATPRILQASGGPGAASQWLGRCLMRHRIGLFVLAAAPRFANPGEAKELALSDFYAEGGVIQSFGAAPPLDYLRSQPGPNLWRLLGPLAPPVARAFAGAPIVATIAEDDPHPENRVEACGDSIRIASRPRSADVRRGAALRRHVLRVFARYAPIPVFGTSDRKALGHVCGTARFGATPAEGVIDGNHRVHGTENLYISDASSFPTSGGVNPALTVAANALRLAAHLDEVL